MIEVKFDTTNDVGGDGSLTVRHILGNDIPVEDITGMITDPAGGIIPVNTPSNLIQSLTLPLDANGKIIYGVYKINLQFDGEDYIGEYKLCDRRSVTYPITADIYCLLGIAEIKDNGPYLNGAIIDRTFTIRRPAVASFDEEAREDRYTTKNRGRMRIEVGYGGVDYALDVSGTAEATINASANLQVLEEFQTSVLNRMADCRKSLCKIADCVDEFAKAKESKAVACNTTVSSADSMVIVRVQRLFSRLMAAIQCMDVVGANTIYTDIEKIIGPCECRQDDNTPVRIGFDVAVGIARRNPINLISATGSSQTATLQEGGRVDVANVIELDELAGRVIRRGGEQVDLDLKPSSWSQLDILPAYLDGGIVDLVQANVWGRLLPSLGGFVQIYGTLRTSTGVYTSDTVITNTVLPQEYRVDSQDSMTFPLFNKNRYVIGSARVRSDGHIVIKTNIAPPAEGEVLPILDDTYYFCMNYDPSLSILTTVNPGL